MTEEPKTLALACTFTDIQANVKDCGNLKVVIGTTFELEIMRSAPQQKAKWFSDNDPVLAIVVSDNTLKATIKATEVGTSLIEVRHFNAKRTIKVDVALAGATKLGVKFTDPTLDK
jgi:hypothetical protein